VCVLGRPKETCISAPQERSNGGGIDTRRTISFSDAVIAIAITLLALDLKVPQVPESFADAELLRALLELWPNLFRACANRRVAYVSTGATKSGWITWRAASPRMALPVWRGL
jgi:hypothetical protein